MRKETELMTGKKASPTTIQTAQKKFAQKVNKETAYKMWINCNGDLEEYLLPVLPEKFKITAKGETTSATIDQFGEVIHKGHRDAMVISFSSFFPAEFSRTYCSCPQKKFRSPTNWHNWLIDLEEAKVPAHIVLTGSPLSVNFFADVVSYTPEERGGDPGTIYYSIELKEHREAMVRTYKKSSGTGTTTVTTTAKRINNKPQKKTYTIKSGDCIWNIAKKYYGNGAQYTKIVSANRSVLDKAARKMGYSSCNNGNVIFPGTVITIP